jgi:hypothetical protein
MFSGSVRIQTIPLINTAFGTTFNGMFNGCSSLQSVPLLDTGRGIDFGFMFQSCISLQSTPGFNTSLGTSFGSMFNGCYAIQSIALFDTSKSTGFVYMFQNCSSLQSLPAFNVSSLAIYGWFFTFNGTTSIAKAPFQGAKISISFTGMSLGKNAIVDIFNGLGTASGAQSIGVSSNPGYPSLTASDIVIATNKGWVVA